MKRSRRLRVPVIVIATAAVLTVAACSSGATYNSATVAYRRACCGDENAGRAGATGTTIATTTTAAPGTAIATIATGSI